MFTLSFQLIWLFFKFSSAMYVVEEKSNCSEVENSSSTDPIETFKRLYPVNKWMETGFFTEDYINRINPYWLQFQPAGHFSHFALGVVYIIFLVVGLFGNLMVIFMFLRWVFWVMKMETLFHYSEHWRNVLHILSCKYSLVNRFKRFESVYGENLRSDEIFDRDNCDSTEGGNLLFWHLCSVSIDVTNCWNPF